MGFVRRSKCSKSFWLTVGNELCTTHIMINIYLGPDEISETSWTQILGGLELWMGLQLPWIANILHEWSEVIGAMLSHHVTPAVHGSCPFVGGGLLARSARLIPTEFGHFQTGFT